MLWCGCCVFSKWRFNSTGCICTSGAYVLLQHHICIACVMMIRHTVGIWVLYLRPAVSGKWGEGIPRSCDPVSTIWVMTIVFGCEWHWRLKNIGSSTLRLGFEEEKWVMWYETRKLRCDQRVLRHMVSCNGTPSTSWCTICWSVHTSEFLSHTDSLQSVHRDTENDGPCGIFFSSRLWLIDQQ